MQDWTVIHSSEFKQNLAYCFADFRARLAAYDAAPKGKSAKQLQKSIAGFNHFIRKLRKLNDKDEGAVLPEKELAYIRDDSEGTPIYSLIGDELKKLNWFLIAGTAVSAFVCAFGDLIARHYGAQ